MSQKLATEYWPAACREIQKVLSKDTYDRWFSDISVMGDDDANCLTLVLNNDFLCEWIRTNYGKLIVDSLRVVNAPQNLRVEYRVAKAGETQPPFPQPAAQVSETPKPSSRSRSRIPPRANLNEQYTFEEFVVGPCNSFAHAAASAVAKDPGTVYNPLFIYGPAALGKTHLMQAVGHAVEERNPMLRVSYVTTETLLNEYISAIREGKTVEFRERYRHNDVLLIDDIQFLVGKEGLQEEFFHTFNALHNSHKQIIITCDRPVRELRGLESRLATRFEWGLVTSIEKPAFETRMAILKWKQRDTPNKLADDLLMFIAEHVTTNVRSLEGALSRALAYMSLTGRNLTLETLRQQLSDLVTMDTLPDLTCETIQAAVAEAFSVSVEDLVGQSRPQAIAEPRQIAMYLCRRMTRATLGTIGASFNRNHATVVHACKTVPAARATNAEYKVRIDGIVRKLGRDPDVVLED